MNNTVIHTHNGQNFTIVSQPREYPEHGWGSRGNIGGIPTNGGNQTQRFDTPVEERFFKTEQEANDFFIEWARLYINNNL